MVVAASSAATTAVVVTMATTVVNGLSGFFLSPASVAMVTDAANQHLHRLPQ